MSDLVVKVEGHEEKDLRFYAKSSCGNIRDGVGFANGNEGGWVISFDDFLQMAELAKRYRRTCAFDGCQKPQVSKWHSYCAEHRTIVAKASYQRNHPKTVKP